jgi:hypothetical protein
LLQYLQLLDWPRSASRRHSCRLVHAVAWNPASLSAEVRAGIAAILLATCEASRTSGQYPGIGPPFTSGDRWRTRIAKAREHSAACGDHKTVADDLTGDVLICGPGLWHNIKDDAEMKKLTMGVTKFKVPMKDGVQVLEGKLFQSKEDVSQFWKAFWRRYKADPQAKIRHTSARELSLYWAMISYDIEEPIFTIETKDAVILANFWAKEMKLGFIDDYKDVHSKDEK